MDFCYTSILCSECLVGHSCKKKMISLQTRRRRENSRALGCFRQPGNSQALRRPGEAAPRSCRRRPGPCRPPPTPCSRPSPPLLQVRALPPGWEDERGLPCRGQAPAARPALPAPESALRAPRSPPGPGGGEGLFPGPAPASPRKLRERRSSPGSAIFSHLWLALLFPVTPPRRDLASTSIPARTLPAAGGAGEPRAAGRGGAPQGAGPPGPGRARRPRASLAAAPLFQDRRGCHKVKPLAPAVASGARPGIQIRQSLNS